MAVTQTETTVLQAPYIQEAAKKNLAVAEGLVAQPLTLPQQQIAGLSGMTQQAMKTAQGIGGYQGMLNQAGGTTNLGIQALQQGAAGSQAGFTGGMGALQGAMAGYSGAPKGQQYFGQAGQAYGGAGGQYQPGSSFTAQQGPAAQQYNAGRFQGGQQYNAQGFDPNSVSSYMNPYEDQAVQQALGDIRREGEIAGNQQNAGAVAAGAFGGSRQGLQAAELGRNVLDQQARTAVGMRQAGYQNAMAQAQGAFADQQRREQGQNQFTTQSGQQAFEEQQRRQQGQSQFTTQSGQQAFEEQQRRQQGQSQFGSNYAQQGFQTQQQMAQNQQQFGASMGMSAYEAERQRQLALGQGYSNLGQAQGNAATQTAQTLSGLGTGMAGIGSAQGANAVQLGQGIGSLGTQQANIAGMGQNMMANQAQLQAQMGGLEQQNQQMQMDANQANALAQMYQPQQQVSWMSDIIKGTPSSQQSISTATAPSASPWSQLLGGAGALYGGYKAFTGK
jgi:hypothetical protein